MELLRILFLGEFHSMYNSGDPWKWHTLHLLQFTVWIRKSQNWRIDHCSLEPGTKINLLCYHRWLWLRSGERSAVGLLILTVSFRRLSGSSFLARVISSLKPLLSIGCLVCLKYGAGLSLFPWGQVCSHNQSARNPSRVCMCVHTHRLAFPGEECTVPESEMFLSHSHF